MHVLRNVYEALTPRALLLDIHPTGDDAPIRAAGRGLGFVDSERFRPIVVTTNAAVDAFVADGLLDDVRRLEREVLELYADPEELIDTAGQWENLRLAARTRQRIRAAQPPIQLLWRVDFRLLRKRARRRRGH